MLVFALDTAKGTGAALLSAHLPTQLAAGVASILGHVFSPWVRFKGGRGVATSLGVFFALLPVPTLCALALWSAVLAVSKRVSAASVSAAFAYPFLVAGLAPPTSFRVPLLAAASLVAALILVRHVPNMRRLAAGTEPRTIGRKAGKP